MVIPKKRDQDQPEADIIDPVTRRIFWFVYRVIFHLRQK